MLKYTQNLISNPFEEKARNLVFFFIIFGHFTLLQTFPGVSSVTLLSVMQPAGLWLTGTRYIGWLSSAEYLLQCSSLSITPVHMSFSCLEFDELRVAGIKLELIIIFPHVARDNTIMPKSLWEVLLVL